MPIRLFEHPGLDTHRVEDSFRISNKFWRRTVLHNSASIHDDLLLSCKSRSSSKRLDRITYHAIVVHNRLKSMGDGDHSAIHKFVAEGLLNLCVGLKVNASPNGVRN
jgi:hypothetical protein